MKQSASMDETRSKRPEPLVQLRMDLTPSDFTSTITIALGSTGCEFIVHKNIACNKSPFLRACLQGNFKEGEEQRVVIKKGSDENAMKRLITWMYMEKMALFLDLDLLDEGDISSSPSHDLQLQLMKLYILADRFIMSNLKDDIVDCFDIIIDRHWPNIRALRLLFDHGLTESPLRRLILHDVARQISYAIKDKSGGQSDVRLWSERVQNQNLLMDDPEVAQATLRLLVKGFSKTDDNICDFHEHDGDAQCSRDTQWVCGFIARS